MHELQRTQGEGMLTLITLETQVRCHTISALMICVVRREAPMWALCEAQAKMQLCISTEMYPNG
jgi:hypothetical protein